MNFSNLWEFRFNYAMGIYFLMSLLNIFIYWGIGLYLTLVLPSEFGTRRGYLFCISPSYWCKNRRSRRKFQNLNDGDYSSIDSAVEDFDNKASLNINSEEMAEE